MQGGWQCLTPTLPNIITSQSWLPHLSCPPSQLVEPQAGPGNVSGWPSTAWHPPVCSSLSSSSPTHLFCQATDVLSQWMCPASPMPILYHLHSPSQTSHPKVITTEAHHRILSMLTLLSNHHILTRLIYRVLSAEVTTNSTYGT